MTEDSDKNNAAAQSPPSPVAAKRAATVALRPNWSATSTAPAAVPRPSASSISPTLVLQE